jgi:hypothetical protein
MLQVVSCFTLESISFSILWMIDFSDGDRSPPHGVHPCEWEVDSSFSTINDTFLQLKEQTETGDFVAGVEDEPGELSLRLIELFLLFPELDLPIRTPPPESGDSDNWEFGPSFSTTANVFTVRAVSII